MIDELRKNIDSEIEILREITSYSSRQEYANENDKRLLEGAVESLKGTMKIINNTIPDLLNNVTVAKKIGNEKGSGMEKITYSGPGPGIIVTLSSRDKKNFLNQLSINEGILKRLKRKGNTEKFEKGEETEFKAARGYLKLSNRFFLNTSLKLISKGNFKPLSIEIKKANLDLLFETYIAMILLTTLLSVFASLFLWIFFTFFNLNIFWPFITPYNGNLLIRMFELIWIPVLIPVGTFFALYFYPSTERKSISKKIENELPFAVIHMGAISGSGITPVDIFKIIGTSKEYPNLRKEIRKVLNQINLYGYDLVTALNNVAKSTPSTKLTELFAGLTTNINSGGSLQVFFEKRAETLLNDYRLERERYTRVAETFMDIYITVVIAAPMIIMLLLVMVSVTGFNTGFTPGQIALILIMIISVINIMFLGLLQLKQPGY